MQGAVAGLDEGPKLLWTRNDMILVGLICGRLSNFVRADKPDYPELPHKSIRNIDMIGFNEPSGIVSHRERRTLFVVGDNGDLVEMRPDGTRHRMCGGSWSYPFPCASQEKSRRR